MEALRSRARPAHRCRRHGGLKLDSKTKNWVPKENYDGSGNRLTSTLNGTTVTSAFNDANQMTTVAGSALSYDGAGNFTSGAGFTLAYSAKNHTSSVTPPGGSAVAMTYADADQTERTAAGGTTFVDGLLGLARETTASAHTYYWRDPVGALVAEKLASGARYYYLSDALGSVVGLVATNGTLAQRYTYDPYGGRLGSAPTVANPFQFAGGYRDTTGLTKFGARYYNPTWGRWTQQDALAGSIGDPQTINRYAYVSGNPVNFVDPSGLAAGYAETCAVSGTVGGAFGAGAGAIGGSFAGPPGTLAGALGGGAAGYGLGCVQGLIANAFSDLFD